MIIRLSGGLGNQMFQYAMGRAVSEAKGEKLYIDTYGFKRDPQREYALGEYPIRAEVLKGFKKCWYNFLFYANRKLHFIKRGKEKFKLYFEKDVFVLEDLISNRARFYEGCWQNVRYFENIRNALVQELDGKGQLRETCRELCNEIEKASSVAVHVRHGDYLTNQNQTIYAMPTRDYYKKAMAYVKERVNNPVFYFFSDDTEWCRKEFGGEESCVIPEIFGKSSQEDMYLMQSCKHHIIANSSFSWWAAYLGRTREGIQIAPSVWYRDERENLLAKDALLNEFVVVDSN